MMEVMRLVTARMFSIYDIKTNLTTAQPFEIEPNFSENISAVIIGNALVLT